LKEWSKSMLMREAVNKRLSRCYETKILLREETVNKGAHETGLSKDGRFSDCACNQLRP